MFAMIVNAEESFLIHRGYDANGSFIEEMILIPENACENTFVRTLRDTPPEILNAEPSKFQVVARADSNGNKYIALQFLVSFEEFSQLVPRLQRGEVEIVTAGTSDTAVKQVPQVSIFQAARQQVQRRPVLSTSTAFIVTLLVDYWSGGGINLFGALDSRSGGSSRGNESPPLIIVNHGNLIITSGNDNSPSLSITESQAQE